MEGVLGMKLRRTEKLRGRKAMSGSINSSKVYLNVFTEFATCCARNEDDTTEPARHREKRGSLN